MELIFEKKKLYEKITTLLCLCASEISISIKLIDFVKR